MNEDDCPLGGTHQMEYHEEPRREMHGEEWTDCWEQCACGYRVEVNWR